MTEKHDEYPYVRGIYCNRTLNLRTIGAIGYDMDYTLLHYNVREWEGVAYKYIKQGLLKRGFPVEKLEFDPDFVIRGLIIDRKLGNIVKANRFGYVKLAMHGTKLLSHFEMREAYARTIIDLSESRYFFLNTLFSLSEACIYAQLVDLLDADRLPGSWRYDELYDMVRSTLDNAHIEGALKDDIMSTPEKYVELDPEIPLALLDQKHAGKKLLLITNSEWHYTKYMMSFAFDRYLPGDMKWRDLFDYVVVFSKKPGFFQTKQPLFEVVNEEGLLRPVVGKMEEGKVYFGGNANIVEESLGMQGDDILYVGDHIFGDVNVSKNVLRWRTALVLHELEEELTSVIQSKPYQQKVRELMDQKTRLEDHYSQLRLQLQRQKHAYGERSDDSVETTKQNMKQIRDQLVQIDHQIPENVMKIGSGFNACWGHLLRTSNDKSHLTYQIERYADIYMSRVSNFLRYTPFMYFRSPRGSLPHDMNP